MIGIELTGEFMAQATERLRRGDFAETFTHFHQRNLMEEIFLPNSIDTTICNSTTHELWSYGQQIDTLRTYLKLKYKQTRVGGRLIIRDVCGEEKSEQMVYLWCNQTDGSNKDIHKTFATSKVSVSPQSSTLLFYNSLCASMFCVGANDAPSIVVHCCEIQAICSGLPATAP